MADSPDVNDLLSRWERERLRPEDLCRDCPELLEELRKRIAALEDMAFFLRSAPETSVSDRPSRPSVSDAVPDPEAQRLALLWQALHLQKQDLSLQDVCRDHPDLIGAVQQLIEKEAPPTQGYQPSLSAGRDGGAAARIQAITLAGRYHLQRPLGRGGFGEVWQGFDPVLGRQVAIKKPRPDRSFSAAEQEQFLAEARKLAILKHPHIVPVYDAGRDGDDFFIVSEFIDGPNLATYAAGQPLPVQETVAIVLAMAEALHHAHLRDVVHRDVKCSNILLDKQGKPYLTDFGLAISEEELVRAKPGVLGTYAYMAPEQARGDSHLVDARSDVYSLGVVLYELLTGRLPFKAANLDSYRQQILHRPPRPLRTIDDSLPPELEAICLKCLAKAREERYPTAIDLAEQLRSWLATRPAPAPVPAAPTPPPRDRWRLWAALAGVVVGLGLLGLLLMLCWGQATMDLPEGPGENRREQKPTVTTPLPQFPGVVRSGVWHNLFAYRPFPVVWQDSAGNRWDFNASRQELWISTTAPALIGFGQTGQSSYDLEVEVQQTPWVGGVGLFFGCHTRTINGQPWTKCQIIELLSREAAPEERLFHLRRSAGYLQAPHPALALEGFQRASVPRTGGQKHRLAIQVRKHKLTRVQWQGAELADVVSELVNQNFSAQDYQGTFGVFQAGNTSVFRQARFRVIEEK